MEGHKFSINPLRWSARTVRVVFAAFFLIALPIYLFIGFQPAVPADAANYPVLSIPSIGLDTPVASLTLTDHQLIAPNSIAGVYSQNPNKLFIIGHSSTVFKGLEQIAVNDIFIYNQQGYQVRKIEVLEKADISMTEILAAEDEPTVIIMTCAGTPLPNQDATHRLIVTATALKSTLSIQ